MPEIQISLIITSYNELALLQEALMSAINQTIPFHQIIVVDDCSTDASWAYLQHQEGQNNNLTVMTNAKNLGLGETRNVGMQSATGSYLGFMDGDDWLQPDAHKGMLSLIGNGLPDVCVFNHNRIGSESRTNLRASFFTNEGLNCPAPTTPEEIMLITLYLPASWSKIYRSDFLKQNDIWYEGRIYEDLLWNFRCISLAKSIKCTTKPLINYRIHENSVLASTGMQHFDIFLVYQSVETFLIENPIPEYYVDFIRKYRFNQICFILLNTLRVPSEHKQEFARRILDISSLADFDMTDNEQAVLNSVKDVAAELICPL